MLKRLILACGLAAGAACAQQWEIGAVGGYGFAPDLTVKGPSGSASTGFRNGFALGAYGGHDTYRYWSGEARYIYRYSNLKLSSGNTTVDFGAHTHIATGDFLCHFRPLESRIRPFILFGGGMKVVQGTGVESAAQPLGRFAALTHTTEKLAVGDVGGGVKAYLSRSVGLRFEVHDYISSSPGKVIAAAPGASINGILNDIVASVSVSYRW